MSMNDLGECLKTLRKANQYTQEYVASYLDVIRQSYSHYETGRTTPSLETLQKLAQLYHIPLNLLLEAQLHSNISDKGASIPTSPDSPSYTNLCTLGNLSIIELQLLISFRQLSEKDQQDILDFVNIKANRK